MHKMLIALGVFVLALVLWAVYLLNGPIEPRIEPAVLGRVIDVSVGDGYLHVQVKTDAGEIIGLNNVQAKQLIETLIAERRFTMTLKRDFFHQHNGQVTHVSTVVMTIEEIK